MHRLVPLLLAVVVSSLGLPVRAELNVSPPHAQPMKKKKKDKEKDKSAALDQKCDSMGKPCKTGEDCKLENCKPAQPAPTPEPAPSPAPAPVP